MNIYTMIRLAVCVCLMTAILPGYSGPASNMISFKTDKSLNISAGMRFPSSTINMTTNFTMTTSTPYLTKTDTIVFLPSDQPCIPFVPASLTTEALSGTSKKAQLCTSFLNTLDNDRARSVPTSTEGAATKTSDTLPTAVNFSSTLSKVTNTAQHSSIAAAHDASEPTTRARAATPIDTSDDGGLGVIAIVCALLGITSAGVLIGTCVWASKKRRTWYRKACFWKTRSVVSQPRDSQATLCPDDVSHISVAPSDASSDTAVERPPYAIRMLRLQPRQVTATSSRSMRTVDTNAFAGDAAFF